IFIVLTLIALPMFSAVASAPHCQIGSDSMSTVESQKEILSEHDCCEKPIKVSCSHCGECDCDNAQSSVSFLNLDNTSFSFSSLNRFEQITYAVKIPKFNSSLYRPPITTL
ncbi:MAG: hypothetical protein V3V19_02395, partial [Cocleimonas sp.]